MDQAGRLNELIKRKTKLESKELKIPIAPEIIEELSERICFSLPQCLPDAEFLAVVSAIKSYISDAYIKAAGWSSMRKGYKRILTLCTSVTCPDVWQRSVMTYCLKDCTIVPEYHGIHPDTFDMYRHIDLKTIEAFKAMNKFHAAQIYGVILGCQAFSMFDIPESPLESEETDILVIREEKDQTLWEFLGRAFPELKVRCLINERIIFSELIAVLQKATLVVGPLCMATYAASCLKKSVVEIYPTNLSRSWLSKWSNQNYKMIVADKLTADNMALIARSIDQLWKTKMLPCKQPVVLV